MNLTVSNKSYNTPYKPAFGTKIIVSNENKLYNYLAKKTANLPSSGYPWDIQSAVWGEEAYTVGAAVCAVLRLQAEKFEKLFLTHLVPDHAKLRERTDVIIESVENLKKASKGEVSAVLTGGYSDSFESVEQYTGLLNLLDNLDVRTTAFAGQPNLQKFPFVNAFFSKTRDTARIGINTKNPELKLKSELDLKAHFDIFQKNPNDEFIFL